MKELPEGYDLRQAFNDIMYLANRVNELEHQLSEWSEFITYETLDTKMKQMKPKSKMFRLKKFS